MRSQASISVRLKPTNLLAMMLAFRKRPSPKGQQKSQHMPLTNLQIEKAKPGPKIVKLSDGGGLQLWIMPTGSKLWHLAYRNSEGKQKKLAFGPFPLISLADARQKRDEAKRQLANGIDPAQQKRLDKIAKALSDAATFEAVAEEYLAKKQREGMAESTLKRLRSQLRYVLPALGKRPIAEITYASQNIAPGFDRLCDQRDRLLARKLRSDDPDFPRKPKGMRWSTYERHLAKFERLQTAMDLAICERFGMDVETILRNAGNFDAEQGE
jgi:hypothetical protein